MQDILSSLPVLVTAMGMNILLGMYYQIGVQKLSFDKKKLLAGILKGCIIGVVFIGLSYCFDHMDLSSIGITPTMIMHSAILLYVSKVLLALAKTLGVDVKK